MSADFSEVCVASGGASGINVDALPPLPDSDALETHAREMLAAGVLFHSGVNDAASIWSGLANVYQSAEAGQVLSAFSPIQARSQHVADLTEQAAKVLYAYADRARDFHRRLRALRAEVQALDAVIGDNDDWQSKDSIVALHREALAEASALAQGILDSDARCANEISALAGGRSYTAETIPRTNNLGSLDPLSLGFTRAQSFFGTDSPLPDLPWGSPVSVRHEGPRSGGQGFATAAIGSLQGLYTLFGTRDEAEQNQAWRGVFAFGAAALTTKNVIDRGGRDLTAGEIQAMSVVAGAVKEATHYDEWGKDPWRAGGKTLFDLASMGLGGGAGTEARIAALAAKLSRSPAKIPVLPPAGTALIAPTRVGAWKENLDSALARIDDLQDNVPRPTTTVEPRAKGLWTDEINNSQPATATPPHDAPATTDADAGPIPHPDDPPTPRDQLHGKPITRHAEHAPYPEATDFNRGTMETVSDPDAPWGRFDGGHGEPMTKSDYDKRYTLLTKKGEHWDIYPPNAGAVRGTRQDFTSMKGFVDEYGDRLDRIGPESGQYLGVMENGKAASFEERSLPVKSLSEKYFEYRWAKGWPPGTEGWTIEVSRIAPGFGRRGGGLQVMVRDGLGNNLKVEKLLEMGVLH